MAHATANRHTPTQVSFTGRLGIAAGVTGYWGNLALKNSSGYHDPANGVYCVSVIKRPASDSDIDNSAGNDGDKTLTYEFNVKAVYDADSSHAPTIANLGEPGYAGDDHTISTDPEDGPEIGPITDVSTAGVEVMVLNNAGVMVERDLHRSATKQELDPADVIDMPTGIDNIFLCSTGGAVVLTADLPTPTIGMKRTLIGYGTAGNTNYVKLTSSISNLNLEGGVDFNLHENSGLELVGIPGGSWKETNRFIG